MSVSFPGSNKNKAGRLEKSTDEHKRRRQVKTKGGPMQQGRLGGRPHTGPLEDLGNALVSLFPVEMQYNIRGSCRNARRAVHGVFQAVCSNFQKLLPKQEQ
ncbi:hypothetical protein WJX82_007435 [Trebouxia sp. C0006]